ncbi:MAG: transposase, partial [Planctomycetaceae bacterium]
RFLPPYSPDLNPIEELWSKVKSLIQAKRPRTVDEIRRSCQWAFSHITPQDIDGWIHHAYPSLIS